MPLAAPVTAITRPLRMLNGRSPFSAVHMRRNPATMTDKPTPAPAPEIEQPASPPAPPKEKEIGGRGGPDPVRYGDWEKGGIAVDF
ncbi:hypothetical protein GCM10007973_17690 [Polymorphobacter multimanifer]|nr:hypothetical protein GCM10007973_17690 [Polymorphobacter multimanifer]